MVKRNACVFISGTGSNLKVLIKNSREYNFPVNINCVISSSKKAKGLDFARIYGIPYYILNSNDQLNLELILQKLKMKNISLVCLAGYMKILKKKFIKRFNGIIINIHPSLLPKHKGLDTFKKILQSNEKISGCTVHYVNEKLDSGKIILQKKIQVVHKETEKTLKIKIQKAEHKAYSEAVISLFR